jgi:DNA-binding phage protein
MSLAHLKAPKSVRTATTGARSDGLAAVAGSYCGASREPIYRTLNEATESGLEICDTCLADSRKQHKALH